MRSLPLLLVALAACAGAEASTARTAPTTPTAAPAAVMVAPTGVGFYPGESMTFEVGIGGVTAGEAALAVGQIGEFEGHRAIVVTSRAATAGAVSLIKHITDDATTVIDLDTGSPLQLDTAVEMGDKKSSAHARFTERAADVTFSRADEATPHTQHINFGHTGVLETHSAMAQIRTWKPAPGETRTVWVIGGRKVWRVDVKFVGVETIGSAVGNRRAVRFEGASFHARNNLTVPDAKPERTFTVWLSDDADRVPLKLSAHTEIGDVTMALTDYTRP